MDIPGCLIPLLVLSAWLCGPEVTAAGFDELEGGARADAEALSAFARGIRGGILQGWNVGASGEPCAWRGVDCAWIQSSSGGDGGEQFRVVGLELPSSELEGTISAELGLLSELRTLDLSGNRLFGPVPPEIGALPELSRVDLSNNRLSGPIPYGKSFKRDGFVGNPELCGWPLEQACSAPSPSSFPESSSVLSTIAAWFSSLSSRQQQQKARARRFMVESGKNSTIRPAPAPGPLSARIHRSPAPSPIPSKTLRHRRSKMRRWGLGAALGVLVGAVAGIMTGLIGRIGMNIWKRHRKQNGPIIFHHKIFPKMLAFLDKPDSIEQMDVIGAGAAGKVYKATLENGFVVAIKRIPIRPPAEGSNGASSFGKHHTIAEMETLGKIRHVNLAWLYAYIRKPDAHLLLYHFMPNGSLYDAMVRVREGALELDWKARQRIAIDMASGLKYLHYDCNPKILHRDLKTSNILLDEDYKAHLGDFGLAKALPDDMTHVTTQVAGTVGYIAPEYHQTCKFTTSSDVFSMGIVLGVLLCGKEPVDDFFQDVPGGMVGWMCYLVQTGQELRGIDPKLIKAPPENDEAVVDEATASAPADAATQLHEVAEMKLAMRIVCLCTKPNPADRPSMKDVLVMLNPSKLALFRPMDELITE